MGIIKDNLYRISNKSFLPWVKQQPVFPYYHLVRNQKVKHIENLYEYKNVAQFRHDLDFLLANYKPITPDVLLKGKIPKNSFLLTFDDGLEEVYSVIFPVLKEKKLSAIFFINPDFVDNGQSLYKHDISVILSHLNQTDYRDAEKVCEIAGIPFPPTASFAGQLKNLPFAERHKVDAILKALDIDMDQYRKAQPIYITKPQIREMLDAGFYFGGHTMSHPPLQQLSLEAQKTEIIDSMQWLKTHFGIGYSLFAFPFSDKFASKALLQALFEYDQNIRIFGNAGIKKDIDPRIIQRFSLENPHKAVEKQVVTENFYKYFHQLTRKYLICRK